MRFDRLLLTAVTLAAATSVTGWIVSRQAAADDASREQPTDETVAAETRVMLRYQFEPGETVRWKVVHRGSTETKIQGNTQSSESRSESIKVWQVTDVDAQGVITLTHSVASVDMWQKLSDRPEIRFNSKLDETPPAEYQHVAETIGTPLTTVMFQPDGQILERQSSAPQADLGLGDIVMLLPPKAVKIGGTWYEPGEVRVRKSNGEVQRVKTRKLYTLKDVAVGVATISVETQVLTPVRDPSVEAQLVQQLVNGTIRFDLDHGRILHKQMDWDETVVGFNGADSLMKYLARFTEDLLPADGEASDAPAVRARRDDKPAIRRG